jgi:glycerol-3-phosphate dehydrogenase subunit C
MAIGQPLFTSIRASQPKLVTTECATCQMQIEHGTSMKTIHPAELLLQAYKPAAQGASFDSTRQR